MRPIKKKCPTITGSGISKSIHLHQANERYFNMILTNTECALFCCVLLEHFDGLLNKLSHGSPQSFTGHVLKAFIATYNLSGGKKR